MDQVDIITLLIKREHVQHSFSLRVETRHSKIHNACHHLAAVSWGANKNHLEAAQENGNVSLSPISAKGRPSLHPPTP
jgi:hypothetical protein